MSKKKRPRKYKPTFENCGFWEYYKDLERQFDNFLEYVPYLDRNERACSFRLCNILLSIGGHVDSAFKEMAAYGKFSKNHKCKEIREKVKESRKRIQQGKSPIVISIKDCLSAFETEYALSRERIIFKRLPQRDIVIPFEPHNPATKAPEWWDIYNGLKHDFSNHFEKANLRITRDALAAACLINVRHIPAALRLYDFGLLRIAWAEKVTGKPASEEVIRDQVIEMLGQNSPLFVETPLFLYYYGRGW